MSRALSLMVLLVAGSVAGWAISVDPAIAYNNVTGNQGWTGALGMTFQVTRPITIDALGVFDSGQNGLLRDLYVEIREVTILGSITGCTTASNCELTDAGTVLANSPAASATFSAGGSYPLVSGARWQSIPETTLSAGYWMVIAYGYGTGEPNYNASGGLPTHVASSNTYNGAVVWGVGPYIGNAYGVGTLPTVWDFWSGGGPIIRYGAGTFSVVPEPSTYALMGTVGFALYLLRRRKANAKKG